MTFQKEFEQPCIADTSFLSNFVLTGNALLLNQALSAPVNLTPVVLDPLEPLGSAFLAQEPLSEILRPLFFAKKEGTSRYDDAEIPIQTFIQACGSFWSDVTLTEEEEILALDLKSGAAWKNCPANLSKRIRGLDPGESETLAVAMKRKWTLLIDDQAAVEMASCLAPDMTIIRTCQFLVLATAADLINSDSAERLFNDEICGRWGFYAKRPGSKQSLRFRSNPPRCAWE